MRYRSKVNTAIVAVVTVIVLTVCLFVYHNYNEMAGMAQAESTDKSGDISSVDTENSISDEKSSADDKSNIESSEDGGESLPVAKEVFLHNGGQLDLTLNADYAIIAYSDGGVLYKKNEAEKCYPASLTKLLTVAVASEIVDEDYIFTVGDELDFVLPGSSLAYLEKGDVISFKALVDATLLPSGNDAAYVMAVGAGREYAKDSSLSVHEALRVFIPLMNTKANELGCRDTNFVVPDGYHDANHYSTASDMLKIAIYTSKLDIIKNSAGQSRARHVYGNKDITWSNTNLLLDPQSEYYDSRVSGLKTGATNEAGKCLIATAEKDGREVIAVILGASTDMDRYNDALSVFSAVFE